MKISLYFRIKSPECNAVMPMIVAVANDTRKNYYKAMRTSFVVGRIHQFYMQEKKRSDWQEIMPEWMKI